MSMSRRSKEQVLSYQQSKLNDKGLNLVTCGNCGDPFLTNLNEEEHTCPYCGMQGDPCDFPDFFH